MQTIYLLFVVILLFNSNNAVIHKRKGADLNDFTINSAGTWQGKWFPHKPFAKAQLTPHGQSLDNGDADDSNCDGEKDLVSKDFDPNIKQHSYNYLCLTSNHSAYTPNLNTEAWLVKHHIPPSYVPRAKCLNETITYEEELPTFGAYRLLAPKYGTYKYLPPQRWLRSLAEGAIVMAYHPCANPAQVKQLENIVKNCLYRHIITPTQALTPERPLAVLAWGACLRLSVVDETSVVDFIKTNAKRASIAGDISKSKKKYYTAGLLDEAHLITDMDDSEICGYKEM